jgi:hypothetical protein
MLGANDGLGHLDGDEPVGRVGVDDADVAVPRGI